MTKYHKVVIIGAGFGGLSAVRALSGASVQVTLIDRNNYHTFLPLLYQVAAAELEPESIAIPVRSILRKYKNSRFVLGDVRRIDFKSKKVTTSKGTILYDYLIIAIGSKSNFYGVEGASEYSYPLKTLEQGIALRNQILHCFEKAAQEKDERLRQKMLTFAIVGGGTTGIEFAGALCELISGSFAKDFPELDFQNVTVIVLEAAERLLPDFPDKLGVYALKRLEEAGIQVMMGATVKKVKERAVHLEDGRVISTNTVVWTAGVGGDPIARKWGLPTHKTGQVAVLPTLQIPEKSEVYVIGDLAYLELDGKVLQLVAPLAIQGGLAAAKNILRQIKGEDPVPFRFKDKGTMATIGRNAAVAHIRGRSITGFFAWLLWLGVHIVSLIGFRNRLVVMLSWAWDYFFFERLVRLILPGTDTSGNRISRTISKRR